MAGAGKVGIERRNQHREAVFSAAACRCSRSATQRIRAIYTEVNARMESEALRLGDPAFLNEQEAAAAMKTNDALVDSPSALWKQQAMRK